MKIPDKIKIGAHTFDINFVSDADGFTLTGRAQHWSNKITLQSDLMQSKREATLFHECLHEMNCQQDWGLEESKVAIIAESFYTFLVDNGLLK